MPPPLNLLLVPGSLRDGSTNAAFLATVTHVTPPGVTTRTYTGTARLPHFDPGDDHPPVPDEVARLRAEVHRADAVLICTPEYAGALPGSFKNLLDWLIGDADDRSINGKPVAWVNVSSSPTGARDAHHSLRLVLGYAGARVVDAACGRVAVSRSDVRDGRAVGGAAEHEARRVVTALTASLGAPTRAAD